MLKEQVAVHRTEFAELEASTTRKISELQLLLVGERDKVRVFSTCVGREWSRAKEPKIFFLRRQAGCTYAGNSSRCVVCTTCVLNLLGNVLRRTMFQKVGHQRATYVT